MATYPLLQAFAKSVAVVAQPSPCSIAHPSLSLASLCQNVAAATALIQSGHSGSKAADRLHAFITGANSYPVPIDSTLLLTHTHTHTTAVHTSLSLTSFGLCGGCVQRGWFRFGITATRCRLRCYPRMSQPKESGTSSSYTNSA